MYGCSAVRDALHYSTVNWLGVFRCALAIMRIPYFNNVDSLVASLSRSIHRLKAMVTLELW